MAEADVLVNIGNRTSYQLPSKVVEYAAFGKPILNFLASPDDSSAVFLSKYPFLLNVWKGGPKNAKKRDRGVPFPLYDLGNRCTVLHSLDR